MTLLVGAALAVFSLAIVVYPFLRSRFGSRNGGARPETRTVPTGLESIYDAIGTLQLEYQLGRIPEHLYQEQLQGYRVQAATTLRRGMATPEGDIDWLLEQEVLVARAALRSANGGPPPCPNCRTLPGPGMAVCPECGARLDSAPPAP